ncbi:MAG TPA: hemerythrin domain-containing protein [Nitrososphaera sp.]|nr:hemerythrin domain-containing protein [Nitrososphaera sp.]
MSATDELLQDHVVIRRLQAVIEKCYSLLYEGRDIPFGDLVKIADIIEQFVDQLHHGKEEKGYFPETENREHYSDEVRKFVIEHEFGRRIAMRINLHLEEFMRGVDAREPLARYLRTYSVFILDHTSKEDRFFNNVKEAKSLTNGEEKALRDQFERMRHDCTAKSGNMVDTLAELEKADWYA